MTKKKKPTDEAANLPTFDELAEMAAEAEEPIIEEPARDIVNKRRNETKLEKAMREARQEKLKGSPLPEYQIELAGEPLPMDPETGEIDVEKLTDEQRQELKQTAEKLAKKLAEVIDFSGITRAAEKAGIFIKAFQSEKMRDILAANAAGLRQIQELFVELDEMEPFIKAELKKEEYQGKTFDDILEYTPRELLELRNDPGSYVYKAFEAARKAKTEAGKVTVKHADSIEYPLDKINSKAWNLLTEDTGGQIKINFDLLPKKRNLQATAYYSINFDNLGDNVKITKKLTPFDKRVYIAVSALYNAGNDVITATQIYYAMGNTGKPGANQIQKIDDSLSKLTGAEITLNNLHEHEALKGKYPHFKYTGSLLPIERIMAIVNGQLSESAIHFFREPPLMTFAKERNQVTTVDVALLQSPINKTDSNLQIDDYLIDRISRAKNSDKKNCRILFKTLYERAGIKTKMQRQRAPEKVEKYLTHYQQQDFIKRYTMQADGIMIYF